MSRLSKTQNGGGAARSALAGSRVMITGGTSGIGLAAAPRVIAAASFAPFWLCLDVRFAPNNDPNGGHSKMVETCHEPTHAPQQNYRAVSEAMCPSMSKRRYPRRLGRQLRATA